MQGGIHLKGFNIRFTTNAYRDDSVRDLYVSVGYIVKDGVVDIYHSNNIVHNGYVEINIDKDYIKIYFDRGTSWRWWQGSKKDVSAKLSIKFNDAKHMITVNGINKIMFHKSEDYDLIRQKTIQYKLMNANDNRLDFDKRD